MRIKENSNRMKPQFAAIGISNTYPNIRTNELFSIIDDMLHTGMVNAHISDALINTYLTILDRNCISYNGKKYIQKKESEFLPLLIFSEIYLQ